MHYPHQRGNEREEALGMSPQEMSATIVLALLGGMFQGSWRRKPIRLGRPHWSSLLPPGDRLISCRAELPSTCRVHSANQS